MADGIAAQGTVLQLSISSTFTAIAAVTDIDGPGVKQETIDVTHLGSGDWRDKIGGLADGGEVSMDVNFDPAAATHQALTDLLGGGAQATWKIIFADSGSTEWPFTGILTGFKPKASAGDKLAASITIEIDDAIALPT